MADTPPTVLIYDANNGKKTFTLRGHKHLVASVAFSFDSKYLASAGWDGIARVWEVATGKELQKLEHRGYINSVAFSPDGRHLVTAGGGIKIWDWNKGRMLQELDGNAGGVEGVTYSHDGKRLASAGLDGTSRIWDANTGKELVKVSENREAYIYDIAFSPDGKRFATAAQPIGSSGRAVKVWDVATAKQLLVLPVDNAYCVAFSPDGRFIVTPWDVYEGNVLTASGIKFWDAKTGKEVRRWHCHDRSVDSLAFNGDGTRLVTASADSTIKIWDASKIEKSD
jgi:WD40 repeat protein